MGAEPVGADAIANLVLVILLVVWLGIATVMVRLVSPRPPKGIRGMRQWRWLLLGLMAPNVVLTVILFKRGLRLSPCGSPTEVLPLRVPLRLASATSAFGLS
jgi:hypothetical protein